MVMRFIFEKGWKKDFALGKNLRIFQVLGLKVLEKKVSENGPNSVVFLILMINTVYEFFLYPHSR